MSESRPIAPSTAGELVIVEHMSFLLGTAVTYICRAGFEKDGNQVGNLHSAVECLNREIKRLGGGSQAVAGTGVDNPHPAAAPPPVVPKATISAAPGHSGNLRKKPRPRILSDDDRLRIRTLFDEGKKLQQISDILGKPISAVKNVYYTLRDASMPHAKSSTYYEDGRKITRYQAGYAKGVHPQITGAKG